MCVLIQFAMFRKVNAYVFRKFSNVWPIRYNIQATTIVTCPFHYSLFPSILSIPIPFFHIMVQPTKYLLSTMSFHSISIFFPLVLLHQDLSCLHSSSLYGLHFSSPHLSFIPPFSHLPLSILLCSHFLYYNVHFCVELLNYS